MNFNKDDDVTINTANFILREIFSSLSLISTLILIISYVLCKALHIPSFKIFFILAIAESCKSACGIIKVNAQTGIYCTLSGIFEVYTQSCCLASLLYIFSYKTK